MTNLSPYQEAALLEALQAGDTAAFSTLYIAWCEDLYHQILKMVKEPQEAEEIVQELFSRLWQKRSALSEVRELRPYLLTMARNLVYDYFRALKRDRILYARVRAAACAGHMHTEESLDQLEQADLVRKAMAMLPPQQQKVFQLCKLEGFSYKEAGRQLGISSLTVKEYLVKGKRTVRRLLTQVFFLLGLLSGLCLLPPAMG